MGALDKIRVLDFTHVLAGPFCTYQLAMLGADVIKIESPHHIDMMREAGPLNGLARQNMGIHYLSQNSNKRSLSLDLKKAESKPVLDALIASADVLVVNYRPAPAKALGLGYAEVQAIKPDIIYCSMTGFGQTGPKANDPAYDIVIQAFSGLMAATGTVDGGPTRVGPPVLDYGTGAQAAMAVIASLYHREKTGEGNFIDVAMLDAALMLMTSAVTETSVTGTAPVRVGNKSARASYGCFDTASGQLILGAYTKKQIQSVWRTLGREDKVSEVESLGIEHLDDQRDTDEQLIASLMMQKTAAEWESVFNNAGVPAARIRTLDETLGETQVASRSVVQSVGAPDIGELHDVPTQNIPVAAWKSDKISPEASNGAPHLGQHNEAVLMELGFAAGDIDRLRRTGAII